MQDTNLSELPLVDSESDEDDNPDDQSGEDWCTSPFENTASEVQPSQEEGQTRCQESKAWKVKSTKLLQEGEVIQAGVSFWWPVTNEETNCGNSPKRHLNPL